MNVQASVGIVVMIACCMFCRCCGRMRAAVQPLGPNLPLNRRQRRRLNMVSVLLERPGIIEEKIFAHPRVPAVAIPSYR